jgi:uncharacterized radical SAM superfamily protein
MTSLIEATAKAVSTASATDEIHFHAPGFKRYETDELAQTDRRAFVALSVTGTACGLRCDHCDGEMLRWMQPTDGAALYECCERLAAAGTRGVLISGGSDARGRVPLASLAVDLARIKQRLGLKVLVHTGLVDEPAAEALAAARIDGALIDVIGDDETIRCVYHLDRTVTDYARSLDLLDQHGVPSLPHVVMGLHYGELRGEETALRIVAEHNVAGLVLVALMPLLGTPMERVAPPAIDELVRCMRRARELMPERPLLLGCARPGGEAKVALDRAAIELQFAAIAFPADGTVALATDAGRAPRFHETCCGVPWLFEGGAA